MISIKAYTMIMIIMMVISITIVVVEGMMTIMVSGGVNYHHDDMKIMVR